VLSPVEIPDAFSKVEPQLSPARDDSRLSFSTSESLASGLVSRLIREWTENDRRYWENKHAEAGGRGISKLPLKRALAYRVLRERSLALIPPGHQLIVEIHGAQHGLDKRAGFAVVHWNVMTELRRMEVLVTYGKPGWRLPLRWRLFIVADHALQRMFFRLKALSDRDVLAELRSATRTVCAWYPLLSAYLEDTMSIGVPTPSGMLILKRVPTNAPFSTCDFIATTWVSERMMDARTAQAAALSQARLQDGVIVQVGDQYFPLTLASNLGRFAPERVPATNIFYSEMLRHLPLAEPLATILHDRRNKPSTIS
jgi:hypothetical protein